MTLIEMMNEILKNEKATEMANRMLANPDRIMSFRETTELVYNIFFKN